jgi:hypothetical protein
MTNPDCNKIILLEADCKCDYLTVKLPWQMTEIGPSQMLKAQVKLWRRAIANIVIGIRVVELEVYAVLYQIG